jgi:hypothetical protein
MESATIRQKLHDYIDIADDKKLEAMYVILQTDIESGSLYDESTIARFHARRDNHLNESSPSYTVAETIASARNQEK